MLAHLGTIVISKLLNIKYLQSDEDNKNTFTDIDGRNNKMKNT